MRSMNQIGLLPGILEPLASGQRLELSCRIDQADVVYALLLDHLEGLIRRQSLGSGDGVPVSGEGKESS